LSLSIATVEKLLLEVKNRATSPDGYQAWVLRTFSKEIAPAVTHVFNRSLGLGMFPKCFKQASIRAIPKPGGKEFRPISLLSPLSKVLERAVLLHWMQPYVNVALDKDQFAFTSRNGGGTQTALTSIYHSLVQHHDRPGTTSRILAIDFSKAFDQAAMQHILEAIAELGAPYELYQWVADYLTDRSQRVIANGICSSWEMVRSGVPQGSVLGPVLFASLINSLRPVSPNTRCVKYADDVTLIHHIPKGGVDQLDEEWETVQLWAKEHSLTINTSKTKSMTVTFSRNSSLQLCQLHSSLGVPVEDVHELKLLGLILSKDLKWTRHVEYCCQKAAKNVFLLRMLKEAGFTESALWSVYDALLRSHLVYAAPATSNMSRTAADKLNLLEKKAKKIIGSSPKTSLETFRQTLCHRLAECIKKNIEHPLRHVFIQSSSSLKRTRHTKPFVSHYAHTTRFQNSFTKYA
jgi:hypothetical protein